MPLEKTPENILTCQVCKRLFKNRLGLGIHLQRLHKLNGQNYYNQFYKQENEGKCKTCQKETKYERHGIKYNEYCSVKCSRNNSEWKQKQQNTCFLKFGCLNPFSNKEIQNKKEQTCLKRHGVLFPMQSQIIRNKSKNTCLKLYNIENISQLLTIQNKKEQTCLKNYGVKHPSQNENVRKKAKQTCLKKYGVECCQQNKEIQEKGMKTRLQSKPYILPSGKIVYKMGYEPQFLDYVFKNNILKENEIDYHPKSIKYVGFDYKQHYYFPDFYIPKWNLIVEIKSDWIMKLDKEVYLKEITTIESGFNYLKILNYNKKSILNFENFNKFITSTSIVYQLLKYHF